MIQWDVVFFLLDIGYVVMFTLFCYNANVGASWEGIDIDFKYIIFDEGMI